ncbi:MAG: sodium:proton antiporter [Lachnospiraceae bacterium]|nr:sodium:proton antiporter [Lachnospiraceae bacterium]
MFITVLIILAIMLFACLIRAVKGPRIADRIVAINMMGTMVMVMIAVLSLLLREGYLVDICLIYAMVSFLAVIVISKVYLGVYKEKRQENEEEMSQMTGEGGDSDGNY